MVRTQENASIKHNVRKKYFIKNLNNLRVLLKVRSVHRLYSI